MQVDALTMQVDAFTMQVDAFTMQVDAFTMQADAFTMQADALTMQADALTMQVDALQKLTLFYSGSRLSEVHKTSPLPLSLLRRGVSGTDGVRFCIVSKCNPL